MVLGEQLGFEQTTLNSNQLPPHTHSLGITLKASNENGNRDNPTNNIMAIDRGQNTYNQQPANVDMAAGSIELNVGSAGANPPAPFDNRQPSLALRYIICLYGVFPSRS